MKVLEELFIYGNEVRRWGNVANLGKVKALFGIFVFIFLKTGPGEVTFGREFEMDSAGGERTLTSSDYHNLMNY